MESIFSINSNLKFELWMIIHYPIGPNKDLNGPHGLEVMNGSLDQVMSTTSSLARLWSINVVIDDCLVPLPWSGFWPFVLPLNLVHFIHLILPKELTFWDLILDQTSSISLQSTSFSSPNLCKYLIRFCASLEMMSEPNVPWSDVPSQWFVLCIMISQNCDHCIQCIVLDHV